MREKKYSLHVVLRLETRLKKTTSLAKEVGSGIYDTALYEVERLVLKSCEKLFIISERSNDERILLSTLSRF